MAQDIGGRVQPASGARDHAKGDTRRQFKIRGEAKTTSKNWYRLRLVDLLKIKSESLAGGDESWVLQFEFQGQQSGSRFAVLDWKWFTAYRSDEGFTFQRQSDFGLVLHLSDLITFPRRHIEWALPTRVREYAIVPWHIYQEIIGETFE